MMKIAYGETTLGWEQPAGKRWRADWRHWQSVGAWRCERGCDELQLGEGGSAKLRYNVDDCVLERMDVRHRTWKLDWWDEDNM